MVDGRWGRKAGPLLQVQVKGASGWGRQIHHAPLPILGLRALRLLPTVLSQPLTPALSLGLIAEG